jgi:hypothetical protein
VEKSRPFASPFTVSHLPFDATASRITLSSGKSTCIEGVTERAKNHQGNKKAEPSKSGTEDKKEKQS